MGCDMTLGKKASRPMTSAQMVSLASFRREENEYVLKA